MADFKALRLPLGFFVQRTSGRRGQIRGIVAAEASKRRTAYGGGGGGAHGRGKDLYADGFGATRGVVRMRAVAAERTRRIRARRASVQGESTAGASTTRAHCWRQHDIGSDLEHFLDLILIRWAVQYKAFGATVANFVF